MSTDDPRLQSGSRVSRQQRRAEARKLRKRKRRGVADLAAGAAIALGAAALASPASAATITVNSNLDVIANDDGKCTLREAVLSANTDTPSGVVAGECVAGSGADIVDLTSLTGTITLQPDSAGTQYGVIGIYTSMNITGPGAGTLSISGGGATQIFYMYSGIAAAAIGVSGLTLTNGYGDYGGAIQSASAGIPLTITISDTNFTNNVASRGGGAIAMFDLGSKYGSLPGSVSISNATFQNNVSNVAPTVSAPNGSGGPGGAIFAKYLGPGASVLIDHATITGNHARTLGGGIAAAVGCSADMTIQNSVVTGNDAGIVQPDIGTTTFNGPGGGVAFVSYTYSYSPGYAAAGALRKARTEKIGGKPRLNAYSCDVVTIRDSTISNNVSDQGGGGVFSYNTGLTIDRTTISGNTASFAGAMALYYANATITNATIANNNAVYYGGGIAGYSAVVNIDNTTITGNSSPGNFANAIVLYSDYGSVGASTLTNSIIAGNGTGKQLYAGGTVSLTVSFSDVFPADATPAWTDGGNNISADPLLGALAPDGTPNQGNGNSSAPLVEIPAAGSPVIDAGNTAAAAGAIDERGSARVFGAAVDMGSVEVGAVVVGPGTVTTNPTITVNENAGTVTITLNRTGGSTGALTVNYSTANGTATSPSDYAAKSGTVTWADGDVAPKTITISIVSDHYPELPETFTVSLTTSTSGAVIANPTVTVTILDPAAVPTLAFWMKLMLALTCAGVGVVMLKNGRLLVVVLAAGIAVAAAPSVQAAAAPTARTQGAGRHADPPAAGTVTSVSTSAKDVTVTIGTSAITAPRHHLTVVDLRNKGRKRVDSSALTAGTPVMYRVVRKADGSVRRLRIGIFDSITQANNAVQRLITHRGHH